jgi:N-methylhydantoinase A
VLSALGAALADVVKDYSRSLLLSGDAVTPERVRASFEPMERQATAELAAEGFAGRRLRLDRMLDMRYAGQSYELTLPCPRIGPALASAAARRFHRAHRQRFGYSDPSQPVEVVTARLKAVGYSSPIRERAFEDAGGGLAGDRPRVGEEGRDAREAVVDERAVVFGGRERATRCYDRHQLVPGHAFPGPALVFQMDATTVLNPGWEARVDAPGNLVMEPTDAP